MRWGKQWQRGERACTRSRDRADSGTACLTAATGPKATPAAPTVTAVRIDVQFYEDKPLIVAFVMRSAKRVLATRVIELMPSGVNIACQCEKPSCPADGYTYRPAPVAYIAEQVGEFLEELRREYLVPAKKVHYLYMHGSTVQERPKLVLPPVWRDPERLAEATRRFARM